MNEPTPSIWEKLSGELIVLDMSSPFVIIGKFSHQLGDWILLSEADVHDLRDTPSTREKYVLDSRMHGVRTNRHTAWVQMREVVAVSRLDDVIVH